MLLICAAPFSIQTIAEGVETVEIQRYDSKKIGVSYLQGYLYSKPVPAAEFSEDMVRRKAFE